jgi:hypothetical protein
MTKKMMKQVQAIQPQQKFYRWTREGLIARALDIGMRLKRTYPEQFDPQRDWWNELAPLNRHEQMIVRGRI